MICCTRLPKSKLRYLRGLVRCSLSTDRIQRRSKPKLIISSLVIVTPRFNAVQTIPDRLVARHSRVGKSAAKPLRLITDPFCADCPYSSLLCSPPNAVKISDVQPFTPGIMLSALSVCSFLYKCSFVVEGLTALLSQRVSFSFLDVGRVSSAYVVVPCAITNPTGSPQPQQTRFCYLFQFKFCELSIFLARSGYRPQCFCSAALVGGNSGAKKKKVYAGQRPQALRKGPLTSRLERVSPRVPENYTSYS
eukprot:1140534-Pelagomonas_calceolata.AAC.1